MTDQLHASILLSLAQTSPVLTPAATSVVPSPLTWIAIVLIGAGLLIAGIAAVGWLRRRTPAPDDDSPSYEMPRPNSVKPLPAQETIERAPIARPPAAPAPQASSTTIEAQNLLRLMGEAEELCARLGRDLDDKAQRIERLLARAEGRLGSDFAAQGVQPAPQVPAPRAPMPAPQPAAAPRPEIVTRPIGVPAPTPFAFTGPSPYYNSAPTATQPVAQGVPTRIASPLSGVEVHSHPQHVSQPQAASQRSVPSAADPFGLDPLTRDIYTLADAGHSAQAIAQQLGQHTGKVELILALRPG